jgi:hypothetical protein
MDGQRTRDRQVTLDAMDAAIQAAVNADPSPEFVARVRTRIAEQPAPRRWTLHQVVVFSSAVAVLAVLAFIARTTGRLPAPLVTQRTVPLIATSAPGRSVDGLPGNDGAAVVRPAMRPRVAPAGQRTARGPSTSATTEGEALRQLLDSVNRGTVTMVLPVADASNEMGSTSIPNLDIPPLRIPIVIVEPIRSAAQ